MNYYCSCVNCVPNPAADTLTRCQEECTRLLLENRRLEEELKHVKSGRAWGELVANYAQLKRLNEILEEKLKDIAYLAVGKCVE